MSARLKFALALSALVVLVAAAVVALTAGIVADLPPAERSVVERVLRREVGFAAVVAVGLLMALAALVATFFNRYVLPPRRMAREVELIAAANPSHRLEPRGPAELGDLAAAVNRLARRSESARTDVEGQIAAARADLERERNRLAALMSELTLAVVVCNLQGRILLYNAAAAELLGEGDGGAGMVGLGRSIFGVLDRGLVEHALTQARPGPDAAAPAVQLTAASAGRLLRVGLAPVRDRHDEPTGFVLTLEDVTARSEESARRDALLRSLTEGTRACVGSIRAAVENMIDYPGMDSGDRQRFEAIIRDEALRLSAQLEAAVREASGYLRSQWSLADMLGRDLVAALQRSLESEAGVAATAEAADDLWLRVDSYALVRALVGLASRLRADVGVSEVALRLQASGRHARLDLEWHGPPLDPEALRAWTVEPAPARPVTGANTLTEVVELHGGEVWCQAGRDVGSARVRLLLPLADAGRAGRGLARRGPPAEGRPEFYDFDLFRPTEVGAEWDQRRLDELDFTVFDTETTGLSPSAGDEIVSIAAVRIVNGRLLRRESIEQLVDPGRSIPPQATAIHGISPEMVAGQPRIEEALPRLARFAEGTVLVGHNVGFDLRFIELKETHTGVRLTQPVLDTLLLSAVIAPEEEDHSLEAMAERLGVSVLGRHTALGDSILTGEIFLRQMRLLDAQGLVTLGDVREAARRTYLARVSDSLYSRS